MSKAIEVEVYGQRFILQGEADEAYFHELAEFVDGQIRLLAEKTNTGTLAKLAILAAFNIADQLFQQERTRESGETKFEAEIERRAQGILDRIEFQLQSTRN